MGTRIDNCALNQIFLHFLLTHFDRKCYNPFYNHRRFFAEDDHYHVAVSIAIVPGNDYSFGGKRMKDTIKVLKNRKVSYRHFHSRERLIRKHSGYGDFLKGVGF